MNAAWLDLGLAWRRTSVVARVWVGLGVAALAACTLVGMRAFELHALQRKQTALEADVARFRQAPTVAMAAPPVGTNAAAARFRDGLGASGRTGAYVKVLFAAADANGLTLSQAQYKVGRSDAGEFQTYQVDMPLVGRYPAVRAFCEQVLLALPFAAIEEVRFKRDSASQGDVQASVRLVLYLDESVPLAAGAPREDGGRR